LWWVIRDSNTAPKSYEGSALTN